ncbi:V-set domain-containing T-cell activation inhibitor 1-like isoform X3 [Channa argus]
MSDLMRFSVIYVFVSFSLTAVSCLKVIVRSTGKDALLPCVYKGHNPPPETLSIFWRDKDNSPLLNIKKNKADNSSQHQKFRGRVESFPDLYKDGNFSIILKKVQQLDNGVYECHVPMVDVEQRVQLSVLG